MADHRRKAAPRPITEETLKCMAYVIGDASAAKAALNRADEHRAQGQDVRFWLMGSTIFVEAGIRSPAP